MDEKFTRALKHTGTIATGWFTLALAAQQLAHLAEKKRRQEYRDKLKSYVSSQYPVVSPSANETATESEKEDIAGVRKDLETPVPNELAKEASLKTSLNKALDVFVNPIPVVRGESALGTTVKTMASEDIHPMHMAMTIAAALASAGAGVALGKKISAKDEDTDIKGSINKNRAEMDKLFYKEYRRVRGLDKEKTPVTDKGPSTEVSTAVEKTAAKEDLMPYGGDVTKSSSDPGIGGGAWNSLSKMYLLYATLTGLMGFGMAKSYTDKKDPARAREKELLNLAKEHAKMTGAPQLQPDPDDPTYSKLMAKAN